MYKITTSGFSQLPGYMSVIGREQLPFAAMLTLNDLAFMVRDAEMKVVKQVFDRPKPQTVKNFWVSLAKKNRLEAYIEFNQIYDKGYDNYMVPEVEGTARRFKKSETMLRTFYVPGIGAKIDQYGNMQGGQITQILSQLRLFSEVGWDMNRRSKSKRFGPGAKTTEYFVVRQNHGGLVPGVYQRTEKKGGYTSVGSPRSSRALPRGAFQKSISSSSPWVRAKGAVPVMIFTNKAPKYPKRFPFYETAQRVKDANLQGIFAKRAAQCLQTAGFKGKQWGGG